ncbi:MAG: glycosyltransferase [Verrucomicrobiaceae bacterium]|nr:MAG: glycosyltransferase [Verrucomicrobiaceae bacterium]
MADNPLVRWCGVLRPREVMPFLVTQDVFLLLSDYEGLPLSLLEAMAAGTVPVVSDLPSGMREVVRNECGVRVAVGDVDAAVAAIMQLERDRSRVQALSEQASSHARAHYSAERMSRQFEELILSFPAAADLRWPAAVPIPTPLCLHRMSAWAFQGAPRVIRRMIRRVMH